MNEAIFFGLQNGSDIRGISVDTGNGIQLGPDEATSIASAFINIIAQKTGKRASDLKIGVGNDSRISAGMLKNAVIGACEMQGCSCFDCGLTSTPSMYMSTIFKETDFDGAIMITASHMPFDRNGMKFFDKSGGFEKEDIKKILDMAWQNRDVKINREGKALKAPLLDLYCSFLREKIKEGVKAQDYDHPLDKMKIVVDAGNGAGGFFVDGVLKPLGAQTQGSQYLEPDGMFPNHIPNPEDKQAMQSITEAVIKNKAEIGIIFDTDVDRASAVDKNGKEINKNAIVGLMAAIISREHPNTTVVTDSVTSDKLTEFIENELHMKHHRFKRGYKNVINEAIRLNSEGVETHLAIETSGHCAIKENHFLDDGAYLCVKVLIEAALLKREGKGIDTLIEGLAGAKETGEFRIKITRDDYKEYAKTVLKGYEDFCRKRTDLVVAENSYEGVRVTYKGLSGWSLLRMSLHDPIMPLNIESDIEGGLKQITGIILEYLDKCDGLDLSILKV